MLLKRTRRNDKFQFADLKQNAVPYIAVMRFGAWLLIFMRKELGQKIIAPRFWQGDDFLGRANLSGYPEREAGAVGD